MSRVWAFASVLAAFSLSCAKGPTLVKLPIVIGEERVLKIKARQLRFNEAKGRVAFRPGRTEDHRSYARFIFKLAEFMAFAKQDRDLTLRVKVLDVFSRTRPPEPGHASPTGGVEIHWAICQILGRE